MIKAVVDTNVFVSGLINPFGNPAKVINMFLNGDITLLYDVRILEEYRNVLRRDRFGFGEELINPLPDYVESSGESILAGGVNNKFSDEDDRKFYEVAKSGGADYLITGNKVHFPKDEIVVNPTEFLSGLQF
jgi:uncharacterized protein